MAWHAAGEFGADQVAWVESPDGVFPANRLFFAEIKDVPFARDARHEHRRDRPAVRVTADRYAYCHADAGPGVRFSDNYPTAPRRVAADRGHGLTTDVPASSLKAPTRDSAKGRRSTPLRRG